MSWSISVALSLFDKSKMEAILKWTAGPKRRGRPLSPSSRRFFLSGVLHLLVGETDGCKPRRGPLRPSSSALTTLLYVTTIAVTMALCRDFLFHDAYFDMCHKYCRVQDVVVFKLVKAMLHAKTV